MDYSNRVGFQTRKQTVYSEPKRILKGNYLTKKGLRLIANAKNKAEKSEIWKKYGKNRYVNNPNAVSLHTAYHLV